MECLTYPVKRQAFILPIRHSRGLEKTSQGNVIAQNLVKTSGSKIVEMNAEDTDPPLCSPTLGRSCTRCRILQVSFKRYVIYLQSVLPR